MQWQIWAFDLLFVWQQIGINRAKRQERNFLWKCKISQPSQYTVWYKDCLLCNHSVPHKFFSSFMPWAWNLTTEATEVCATPAGTQQYSLRNAHCLSTVSAGLCILCRQGSPKPAKLNSDSVNPARGENTNGVQAEGVKLISLNYARVTSKSREFYLRLSVPSGVK